MKQVVGICGSPKAHWVGDGFPVRSLFSYDSLGARISPFLLLDFAGPKHFEPADRPRGVGWHPHRGFETVTIVYDGEVEHRDSTGAGGKIGPGDVQWMTAAGGILHEEFHSHDFTRAGGLLRMIQLWVNLPSKDKMGAPGYQTVPDADIPSVVLPGAVGRIRVIAGEFNGHRGPARTFTPINVWDLRLDGGRRVVLELPEGQTAALAVVGGAVSVDGYDISEAQVALLEREGREVAIEAGADAAILILTGEPIDEPIVGYGPFVMNSETEIRQAVEDYSSGRFGQIGPA